MNSEAVYHNALLVGLRKLGIGYETERVVSVLYEGQYVGTLRMDLVVLNLVVELKACASLKQEHVVQCQKYLRALEQAQAPSYTGLVINFGKSVEHLEVQLHS